MSINISKLEAAKRQLETAIKLYFENEDPVSIHTLVCASYNVLMDIGGKQSIKPIIKSEILTIVKPEKRKMYLGIINNAENFFKHGCRDPNKAIEFNHNIIVFLMFDACTMYNKLSSEDTFLTKVLKAWFIYNNVDIIEGEYENIIMKSINGLKFTNKNDFYKQYQSIQNFVCG